EKLAGPRGAVVGWAVHREMDHFVEAVRLEQGAEIIQGEGEAAVQDLEGGGLALLGGEYRVDPNAVQTAREADRQAHAGDRIDLHVRDASRIELREGLIVGHVRVAVGPTVLCLL